jgi:hypothetical protein
MVATDSGMSCKFSLRRCAVTTISSSPLAASAGGVSVSPVAWADAGAASAIVEASERRVQNMRRIG